MAVAKPFMLTAASKTLALVASVPILCICCHLNAQETYTISTLSGANSSLDGYFGDGTPAIQARLNRPAGLALGPTIFSTDFDKLGRIPILKARMNADLHMAASRSTSCRLDSCGWSNRYRSHSLSATRFNTCRASL